MKKLCIFLWMFVFLGFNLSAESPQFDLPSTDTEVSLLEHTLMPEIPPEIEEEHDVIEPSPEIGQSNLYFFLIPKRFSFELPAFTSSPLHIEEKTGSPYLLGIADFRTKEEAWTVSVSVHQTLDFDAVQAISWKNEAKAFYGQNEEGQVIIDLEESFREEGIETKGIEYFLENDKSQKIFAQSKDALYGYYAIAFEDIALSVDAYPRIEREENENFLLEWTLSTDLRIGKTD